VRIDTADVTAAAAFNQTTVSDWSAQALSGIDYTFKEAKNVQLIDKKVFNEPGKVVLRYRFIFDSAAALSSFLAQPFLEEQFVYPAKGAFTFNVKGDSCGAVYSSTFTFTRRSESLISKLGNPELDALVDSKKEHLIRKLYSGSFKLRMVLPGKTAAHDAEFQDVRKNPIYQTSVLTLFRKGLKGGVRSVGVCEKGQPVITSDPAQMPEPITIGSLPTIDELNRTANSLANFVDILMEFDCDKWERVKIAVTFQVKQPLKGPFEFYFPLLFPAFPMIETGYNMTSSKVSDDLYSYRFELKKKIRIKTLKSKFIFFGRQWDYFAFRISLPKMTFFKEPTMGRASTVLLRIKATLPGEIKTSNATELSGNTAVWTITDKTLAENKVLLEAMTK